MIPGPDPTPRPEPTVLVEVCSHQSHLDVEPIRLQRLVTRVLNAEGVTQANLSIALVDDAGIEPINRGFLDHQGPTDVLTFPLSDPTDSALDGEIVISAETAAREASARGLDPQSELSLYLIHGLLHLCGHNDHEEADRLRMHARQDELLARLGSEYDAP